MVGGVGVGKARLTGCFVEDLPGRYVVVAGVDFDPAVPRDPGRFVVVTGVDFDPPVPFDPGR